jgi:hypothetical protein
MSDVGEEEGEAMVGFGADVRGLPERGRDERGGRVVHAVDGDGSSDGGMEAPR